MSCADARRLLSMRLDGALATADERRLHQHVSGCRACAAFEREIAEEARIVAAIWMPVSAPAGFVERVNAALPACASRESRAARDRFVLRPTAAIAAALVIVALGTLAVPAARAGVGEWFRSVVLRETVHPPAEQRTGSGSTVSLEDMRRAVSWQVLTPSHLPDGYRLAAVEWGNVHGFADGPTVVLTYALDGRPDGAPVRIVQLRTLPGGKPEEPVAPGAASTIRVGGRDALVIDGEWQGGEPAPRWVRGTLLRLILEDGDRLLWLEADPRNGWDVETLVRVAEGLR